MQLTLDNLDKIHRILVASYNQSIVALKVVDFNADIVPSPENRQLLNELLDQMSGYLVEISHIGSFVQICDTSKITMTAHQ